MEPPIVPMTPRRNRLLRDFTLDDEPPVPITSNRNTRQPNGTAQYALRNPSLDLQGSDIEFNSNGHYGSGLDSDSTYHSSVTLPGIAAPERGKSPPENMRRVDFNLDAIDENLVDTSTYDPSLSSHTSQQTGASSTSMGRMPDFFSSETFQIVLRNPTTSHQLLRFSQERLCGEGMEFLEKVDRYNRLLNDVAKTMFEIHRDFISDSAPNHLNIQENLLAKAKKDLKTCLSSTVPKLESVFVDSQNDIERLVATGIYPHFVRHQITMSASKALAGDRGKYAGLGDCFVLTDPAKADNPITFASDGFVSVTGYSRNEIIPRNCRFLQGRHTDRNTVKRIKFSIDKREESVELLLNEKKTGEPFWNLLYVTPLLDAKGNVVFFLGGQINCSTTIHNASDILRILSLTNDVEEDHADLTQAETVRASRSSRFFSVFKPNKQQTPVRPAGMERNLLDKIERMNLKKQMDNFYTAYSRFLVVNYSTFFISFHSSGILDLLYRVNLGRQNSSATPLYTPAVTNGAAINGTANTVPTNQLPDMVGNDIFKFLASHSQTGNLSRDFKSRVKNALKLGQAISLDLTLCTKRYMGFEKFIVHWTPVKDEQGEIGFVVLTFGGAND